jgi:hypothetical protein
MGVDVVPGGGYQESRGGGSKVVGFAALNPTYLIYDGGDRKSKI